jgi:arginyl-tRNA synthetase
VEEAALTKNPAVLTNFLYALAKHATGVYHVFPALSLCESTDPVERQAGVFVTYLFDRVAQTLDTGLGLLGIDTLESM